MPDPHPRSKRQQRRVPPPRMRLTDRDKRTIEAVYHYRVLTQGQIERLLFRDRHRSIPQQRLRLLYDHAYLQRRFLPRVGGIVTSPVLYLLDKRGAQELLKEGYEDLRWQSGDKRVGYEHLEHLLAINSFRLEVDLACQQHEDYRLSTWVDDTTLKQDYDRVTVPGFARQVAIIPDGHFAVQWPRGASYFFLELDRGTMSAQRYRRKVLAYLVFAKSGLAHRRFGTQNFRVLTVTESEPRAANLKQAAEAAGGQKRFWFGCLADFTADSILTRPVWQVAKREGQHPLFGLG